jgi:hypothetical protein
MPLLGTNPARLQPLSEVRFAGLPGGETESKWKRDSPRRPWFRIQDLSGTSRSELRIWC